MSKFKAKKTCRCLTCGAQAASFDSLTEADYFFKVLKPQLDAGRIRIPKVVIPDAELRLVHPRFSLPGGVKVYADFAYEEPDVGGWVLRVIDVKAISGHLTSTFIKNRKMVKALYGVEIMVVQHKMRRR